jgi:hypothetical protein
MQVSAWLEVDVQGATSRAVTSCTERFLLRVHLAGFVVVSLAGNQAFGVQHHGADHWIRARPVVSLAGKLDGMGGPVKVQVSFAVCGIQSWQYTRAESDHEAVIDNRKRSTENLQSAFSAGSI